MQKKNTVTFKRLNSHRSVNTHLYLLVKMQRRNKYSVYEMMPKKST